MDCRVLIDNIPVSAQPLGNLKGRFLGMLRNEGFWL